MPTHVIRRLDEWEAQRSLWEEIHAEGEHHTPFQSFGWAASWWRHSGDGELYIIRVDDPAGATVGFAPLYLRKKYYGRALPHLALIGTKRADYLDVLVRDESRAVFVQELFGALQGDDRPFAFVDLRDVPERSPNVPYILREAQRRQWLCTVDGRSLCVGVQLPSDWDAYVRRLSKRMRKHLRYDRNYLERHFTTVEVRDCRSVSAAHAALQDLLPLYRARWADEPTSARFGDAASIRFEEEVFDDAARRNALRCWLLYVDGAPAACVAGFARGRRVFIETVVHDPAYRQFAVGNVLIGRVIEACIAEGYTEFDFMRGTESYKYDWEGEERCNLHMRLCPDHRTGERVLRAERMYLAASGSRTLQRVVAFYRKTRAARRTDQAVRRAAESDGTAPIISHGIVDG